MLRQGPDGPSRPPPPPGREAVKRNLDAAAFPEPARKRTAASPSNGVSAGGGATNGVPGGSGATSGAPGGNGVNKGSPGGKGIGGGGEATHLISALNPYTNKYVIKVRM